VFKSVQPHGAAFREMMMRVESSQQQIELTRTFFDQLIENEQDLAA